jgi:hypothetical protein
LVAITTSFAVTSPRAVATRQPPSASVMRVTGARAQTGTPRRRQASRTPL